MDKLKKEKKKIGKIVLVPDGYKRMAYEVKVLDVKARPGGISYLVEPVNGRGKDWIRNIL